MQGHILCNGSDVAVLLMCTFRIYLGPVVSGKFCHSFPSYRCLSEIDQSPFTWTSNGAKALSSYLSSHRLSRCSLRRRCTRAF